MEESLPLSVKTLVNISQLIGGSTTGDVLTFNGNNWYSSAPANIIPNPLELSSISGSPGAPSTLNHGYLFKKIGDISLYWHSNGGTEVNLTNSSSGIPTIGSSTDHAITRWSGISGNALQDSNVTLSDMGIFSNVVSNDKLQYTSGLYDQLGSLFLFQDNQNTIKLGSGLWANRLPGFSGSSNLAIGNLSLINNSAHYNIGIGNESLTNNTIGSYNVSIGVGSSYLNTIGSYCTIYGYQANYTGTTSYTTAIGYQAAYNNGSLLNNTAIGNQTLRNNTGSYVTGVGNNACYNSSGSNITAIGVSAAYNGGNNIIAIGNQSCMAAGISNIGIGYNSLMNCSGSNNTCIGNNTGLSLTTGNNNIIIGNTANVDNISRSNCLVIGNSTTSTSTNNTTTINTSYIRNRASSTNEVLHYDSVTGEVSRQPVSGSGSIGVASGNVTLVSGNYFVMNTSITANSVILVSVYTPAIPINQCGAPFVNMKSVGMGFNIHSTENADSSTIRYIILSY